MEGRRDLGALTRSSRRRPGGPTLSGSRACPKAARYPDLERWRKMPSGGWAATKVAVGAHLHLAATYS
jgi:hypothetical protein